MIKFIAYAVLLAATSYGAFFGSLALAESVSKSLPEIVHPFVNFVFVLASGYVIGITFYNAMTKQKQQPMRNV